MSIFDGRTPELSPPEDLAIDRSQSAEALLNRLLPLTMSGDLAGSA